MSFTLVRQTEMCIARTVTLPPTALPSGQYQYLNLQMGRSKLREVLWLESHQNQRTPPEISQDLKCADTPSLPWSMCL